MNTTIGAAALVLAAALAVPAIAMAQDADAYDMTKPGLAIAGRWYVSPMASFTFADNKRDADDGFGGALLIGKPIAPGVNLEAHVFYTEFDLKSEAGNGKVDLTGIGADIVVFPFRNGPAGLFALAGLAFSDGNSDAPAPPDAREPSADSIVGDLGVGYLIGPFDFLNKGGLRAEVRGRFDKRVDRDTDDYFEPVVSVGLLVPIGEPPAPLPSAPDASIAVVPTQAVADSDGDGITDDLDQCPNTPVGTQVDSVGCPRPAPTTADVPAGSNLSLATAAAGDKFILRGVNFEYDKDRLTSEAVEILDGVIDALLKAGQVKVEVGGHTDWMGDEGYNLALSQRRARSVVRYLSAGGVDADRMTSVGSGETKPIADNETEAGRELNRRVELTVIEGAP